MLKLEKNQRHGDISLRLRDQPHFFTKEVRKALGAACAFHLAALLLFHVAPFTLRQSEVILPTVIVQTELPQNEPVVIAQLTENETGGRYPLAPKKSLPYFPEMPEAAWSPGIAYKKEENLSQVYFHSPNYASYFTPEQNKRFSNGTINLSGPLGECALISKPTLEPLALEESQLQRFSVRVAGDTGKVIWYTPLETSSSIPFSGDALLSQLVVKSNVPGIIEGEVEIVYD